MGRCQVTGRGDANAASQGLLRRPDTAFWYQLFQAPPPPTEADRQRRQRIARYALGAATVMSALYVGVAVAVDAHSFAVLILLNAGATLLLAFGMWMASLKRAVLAREILMLTVTAQFAALLWLTGAALMIIVFAPVIAALARVLYSGDERRRRVAYVLVNMALFALGAAWPPTALIDFTVVPTLLLDAGKAGNALVAVASLMLILETHEREVLTGEARLQDAQQRAEDLLHAVLPAPVVARLADGTRRIADQHAGVSVLFADIAGFTPWSAGKSPAQVVALLEEIFSRFDTLVGDTRAEKIKTIGDAYMVIAGAPESCEDHAGELARLALAMQSEMARIREDTGIDVDLRIGLHCGPVVAGVIGLTRFSYDVWGDTVNVASRMESHGLAGRVHVSDAFRQALADAFEGERRGITQIKGCGPMQTWWLEGLKAAPGAG
ncbi:MAG: adenylate/guanylate cyclase domain-containing protein [Alcanivoracaceae bacterium]|nr:adenylate/guanylate cyclase domain-containing protein [Alcanivoracaceae bacterium]